MSGTSLTVPNARQQSSLSLYSAARKTHGHPVAWRQWAPLDSRRNKLAVWETWSRSDAWFTVARLWPLLITPFVSALILIEVSVVTAILNPSMSACMGFRLWHHSLVSIYFSATRIDELSHIMGLFMEIKGMWNAGPPVYLITPTVCAYWDMPNMSNLWISTLDSLLHSSLFMIYFYSAKFSFFCMWHLCTWQFMCIVFDYFLCVFRLI